MDKRTKVVGTVVEDPAETMPIGSGVNFASLLFPHQSQESYAWIKEWNIFEGVLLGVVFSDSEWNYLEGSAVMVAPGIAISASHVVDARIKTILGGMESIHCFGITSNGLQIWRVRKITYSLENDLMILGLELASGIQPGGTLNQSGLHPFQ